MRISRLWTVFALLCLVLVPAGAALAEEHEEAAEAPAGPSFRPIEIFTCNFNEGQTMADLMEVTAAWNAWMDEEGQKNYFAAILLPLFFSAEIEFDVAWVGGWMSGAEMGASTKMWIEQGGEHNAAFERVVDCGAHTNFAVYDVHRFESSEAGPVTFTDCTMKEGKSVTEIVPALHKWAAMRNERGHEASQALLFPVFGGSTDADYSFKWVTRTTYENWGAEYDYFGTGGGYRESQEMFGEAMECDSARVYHGFLVRGFGDGDE